MTAPDPRRYLAMAMADDVLIALRRLIRATDMHSKHLSKTVGLTAPQLLLLQILQQQGAMTIGAMAKKMSLSQATVTTIVDRLEIRQLVYREKSQQDKRKVFVCLSTIGETLLASAPTVLHTALVEKFDKLPSWEQSMILAALQRLANLMDAEGIDAAPVLDVGDLDRELEAARNTRSLRP